MQKEKIKIKKLYLLNPFATLFVVLILISFIIYGCESKVKPPITPVGLGYDVPSQESWNANITFTDSGKVTGKLRAGHIRMYSDRKTTELDSLVIVDFFDDQQHHTSILTAERGTVNDITHDFEVHEDVVVKSDSGTVLRTEHLYWSNTTQKVHTNAYVEITSPTEQIQGHGFESDKSLKHYTIFKVTGKAKTNEK
ncbi:MAG: LPS export ABC transporter periplasmic protein LptC [Ignavibacteriales bacterium]|nr:LPS export ABC transporter periplasmic protein LptC [Ignavibacteriales bacterium]